MNETLQQALVAILENAVSATDKAITFLSNEIPIVVQQLLYWKFAQSFIMFLVGLCIIVLVCVGHWKAFEHFKSLKTTDPWCSRQGNFGFLWIMLGGIGSIGVAGVVAATLNLTWLQILIAPKIYLIEYAAKLIKN